MYAVEQEIKKGLFRMLCIMTTRFLLYLEGFVLQQHETDKNDVDGVPDWSVAIQRWDLLIKRFLKLDEKYKQFGFSFYEKDSKKFQSRSRLQEKNFSRDDLKRFPQNSGGKFGTVGGRSTLKRGRQK